MIVPLKKFCGKCKELTDWEYKGNVGAIGGELPGVESWAECQTCHITYRVPTIELYSMVKLAMGISGAEAPPNHSEQ